MQLWPPLPRGRGIDAVWRADGPKPYAIIEAKASYNPAKTLRSLLGEAGDKNERGEGRKKSFGGRGKAGAKGKAGGSDSIRQTNGKVTQMSHGWVEFRLAGALKAAPNDLAVFRRKKRGAYTRHVLFFSIPHAVAHAEALIMHTAANVVEPGMHGTHQLSREWRDSDIEKVVDNRAGLEGRARDMRTR